MGGTYYETSAAAGIFGLFAAGSILVIIGISIWMSVGILLILLLYWKLNTKIRGYLFF